MDVIIIDHSNRDEFSHQLEQNYRLRHKIFVDRLGWEELRKPDNRDVDEYDNPNATYLLLIDEGNVVGGARLSPLTTPTLLMDKFSGLISRELPGPLDTGLDWTRHYVAPNTRSPGRLTPEAATLYAAVMEHALHRGVKYFTFVSWLSMVELLTSFNWKVDILGLPKKVAGAMTVAATIEVSEEALFHMNILNGLDRSFIRPKTSINGPMLADLY